MPTIPFLPYSILVGNLSILCLGLTVYWSQHWLGGFAWDGSRKMFNWHPVLMVTGMVILYGIAALVYRLPFSQMGSLLSRKVLHATLTLIAFISAILGLEVVFNFHNVQKIPNMYSLHSWLGLTAVLLFSCQWLMGFASFLLPWTPIWFLVLYRPVHLFFGSVILGLSTASCISGINEKLFMRLTNSTTPYSQLPAEAWFANILGMLILWFGMLVLLGLAIPGWKQRCFFNLLQPLNHIRP
uniref:Lysosomal membrane ascorbate-dependent ferrireductase CYB561A3 n=1 Tax=Pseudonaja textilis TaxID=8673 RepID=A0A670Z5C9_PSETE